jgi:diguanylate cyclase (GGDEF)-like protein
MAQHRALGEPAIESLDDSHRQLLQKIERLERELSFARHQACHDALTGLPNRELLLGRLRQAMLQATRQHKMVAVLLMDLDGFKTVNDRLGHHAGDLILRRVAERLIGSIRGCDTACRYGGDEFVVLLPEIDRVADAEAVVWKIRARLALLHQVGDRQITVGVSIGAAFYREGASTCDALIASADAAMYRAKARRCLPVAP